MKKKANGFTSVDRVDLVVEVLLFEVAVAVLVTARDVEVPIRH